MSNHPLGNEELKRLLKEKILPESGLDQLFSHEKPKALVFAGQPGAGKGALVRTAREEFRGDILVIDADEQRERIPGQDGRYRCRTLEPEDVPARYAWRSR